MIYKASIKYKAFMAYIEAQMGYRDMSNKAFMGHRGYRYMDYRASRGYKACMGYRDMGYKA